MTTAIVTITCPSCGGKIEGITATNAEQTIKCTYCGTELHVPRVGEVVHEVVREVIHEVSQPSAYFIPPSEDIRPKSKPWVPLIILGIGAVIAIPVVCQSNRDADRLVDESRARMQQDDAERAKQESCNRGCKASCLNAGDQDTDDVMRDANRTLCEIKCTQKNDCDGINRLLGSSSRN
jgi:ribosomal protein S27E